MLAVGQRLRLVGDVHQRLRAAVTFTAVIDFQLHAEIAWAVAVEDGVGLEVVVVDGAVLDGRAAIGTVGIVGVQRIPAVVGVNGVAAAGAADVVLPEAVIADGRGFVVAPAVPPPEAAAAVGAGGGEQFETVRAEQLAIERGQAFCGSAAVGSDLCGCHGESPPESIKVDTRVGIYFYNIYAEDRGKSGNDGFLM